MQPIRAVLRTRLASGLLACLFTVAVAACGRGKSARAPAGGVAISREAFISTYVDLRLAALKDSAGVVTSAQRDRILSKHGVTSDDLLHFVEVHGEDVEFMQDVWNDVDTRIRNRHDAHDSASS